MVSLSFLGYTAASVFLATSALAQNLINVDVPQPNANVFSKSSVNITYSVIGTQTGTIIFYCFFPLFFFLLRLESYNFFLIGFLVSPTYNINTTYPSSLSIDFVWSEHANPNNVLSFSVSSGLNTDPYPSGLKTTQHKESWRAPNCHFFSRYPPTTYDFSLVFTPVYPAPALGSQNVGTEQSKIVVPLAITVDNSTFPKC